MCSFNFILMKLNVRCKLNDCKCIILIIRLFVPYKSNILDK